MKHLCELQNIVLCSVYTIYDLLFDSEEMEKEMWVTIN